MGEKVYNLGTEYCLVSVPDRQGIKIALLMMAILLIYLVFTLMRPSVPDFYSIDFFILAMLLICAFLLIRNSKRNSES